MRERERETHHSRNWLQRSDKLCWLPALEMSGLMLKMCKQTIEASHSIWCSWNNSVQELVSICLFVCVNSPHSLQWTNYSCTMWLFSIMACNWTMSPSLLVMFRTIQWRCLILMLMRGREFALNATHDTLPCNSKLHLWKIIHSHSTLQLQT